jgi:hypothetical protein
MQPNQPLLGDGLGQPLLMLMLIFERLNCRVLQTLGAQTMHRVKYDLTDILIVVDLGQDHQDAVRDTGALHSVTQIMVVALNAVTEDG